MRISHFNSPFVLFSPFVPFPSPGTKKLTHNKRNQSLEQVLQNINRLNRNLESVITVGNEFSSVEALWSQFETVMGSYGGGEHEHEREGEGEGENADAPHDDRDRDDGHDDNDGTAHGNDGNEE
ncbi:hypothetical protein ACJ72_01874 [Emergomyces africanus]|uniref:DASH complex subunit DAD1 n=1 Tax=Emergomyces africanus TaxID=1955775 RepID=A0A1B7P417_9EURO|nr:hypothetical protein ACJ72_01874 [Emergomyces africanus]